MLLTQANYTAANTYLTGAFVNAIRQKVLNASVKLTGTVGKDAFTGSATILGVGVEVVYSQGKWTRTATQFTVVMTCKHSLYIMGNAGEVPDTGLSPNTAKWNDALVDTFKTAQICYSNAGTNTFGSDLTQKASIDHVIPIFEENIGAVGKMIAIPTSASSDGTAFTLVNLTGTTTPDGSGSVGGSGGISPFNPATGWAYDVMILLSKDATLYAFASTAGNCDFQAGATQDQLTTVLSAQYNKANQYQGLVPVLSRTAIQLVQTGFGIVSEQLLPKGAAENATKITLPATPKSAAQNGRLQYKLSDPTTTMETGSFYDQLTGPSGSLILTNTHGFILNCDGGNNSTDSGDSGGGVFAIKRTPTAAVTTAVLIGVATGSGSATAADEAPNMWDFDNNVVTSLGPYYAKLFNLRFQNV